MKIHTDYDYQLLLSKVNEQRLAFVRAVLDDGLLLNEFMLVNKEPRQTKVGMIMVKGKNVLIIQELSSLLLISYPLVMLLQAMYLGVVPTSANIGGHNSKILKLNTKTDIYNMPIKSNSFHHHPDQNAESLQYHYPEQQNGQPIFQSQDMIQLNGYMANALSTSSQSLQYNCPESQPMFIHRTIQLDVLSPSTGSYHYHSIQSFVFTNRFC